jgi:hypothetical protein
MMGLRAATRAAGSTSLRFAEVARPIRPFCGQAIATVRAGRLESATRPRVSRSAQLCRPGRPASGQVPEERDNAGDPAVHGVAGSGRVRDNPHDDQHRDDDPEDPSQQRSLASQAGQAVPVRLSHVRRIRWQPAHLAAIPDIHSDSAIPRMLRTTPSVTIANHFHAPLAWRRRQKSRRAPSSVPRIES